MRYLVLLFLLPGVALAQSVVTKPGLVKTVKLSQTERDRLVDDRAREQLFTVIVRPASPFLPVLDGQHDDFRFEHR